MGVPYASPTADQVGHCVEGATAAPERVDDIARERVSYGFHFVPPFGNPRKRFWLHVRHRNPHIFKADEEDLSIMNMLSSISEMKQGDLWRRGKTRILAPPSFSLPKLLNHHTIYIK